MPCGEVDEERKRKLVTDVFVPREREISPFLSRAQRASGLQIFSRVLERERFVLVPVAVCAQSLAQCKRKKETDNPTRDGRGRVPR